ncbi:hypothetical protein N7468_005972 [Penicillium chermesinum]|uniref:BHLH domain-containing protein n=1 Tax=Penicillium chermesinum TaxID=63820 RepID=A0A9W9TNG3_9EURO|nr:uncharacterized protein N7468_005972 [Penicillium chermesinum]KAJ5233016.1 hypothetical protein N7468_005972 [Penicillium chermesinum]KAJ6172660.1 hypothetical protein N7470_001727 [Penicillium chermesinum]
MAVIYDLGAISSAVVISIGLRNGSETWGIGAFHDSRPITLNVTFLNTQHLSFVSSYSAHTGNMLAKSGSATEHKQQIHYTPHRQKRKSPFQPGQPGESGLQWGSDPSFCYHGFSGPIGTWTEERLLRDLMRNMAFMWCGRNIDQHMYNHLSYIQGRPVETQDQTSNQANEQSFLHFGTSQMTMTSPSHSASPSQSTEDDETKAVTTPNKKRKCVQKPGQALCHCRSEKKRREIVSQGYKDLSNLVPGLETQNFTRKYILDETAKYIEKLLRGNNDLREQIAALDKLNNSESPIEHFKMESG